MGEAYIIFQACLKLLPASDLKMASLLSTKPYVNNWAAPVKVSPLIRASRWVALLAGIYYGSSRMAALQEPAKKEYDAYLAQKAITDASAAEAKAAASLAELETLAVAAGIKK